MSLAENDFDKKGKGCTEPGAEIEEQLKTYAEDIEVPEALRPENMEKMLSKRYGKKHRRGPVYTIAAAAAACCMIAIGIAAYGSGTKESVEGEIASAKDYDEIYQYMKAEKRNPAGAAANYGLARNANERSGLAADQGSTSSYSDTNIRQEGVGEGDIVKSDGKHLFILDGQRIQIVDIQSPEMEPLGTIQMEEDRYLSELYVKDDRLTVVYTFTEYDKGSGSHSGITRNYTAAETYDVSKPEKPRSVGKVTQSGNYDTMRVRGDYVYLFSSFYAQAQVAREDVSAYIPEVQGKMIESSHIFLPQYQRGNQYTVVSSFSLKNPGEAADSKAILGSGGLVYVGNENIYVCEPYYNSADSGVIQTCIRKVAYKNGKLKAVGQTKVDGILNDSFSIDEYKGNLRLVTTVGGSGGASPLPLAILDKEDKPGKENQKESNSFYILDKNLKELSRLDDLAADERVYSARFMDNIGYFVTYKQVDPLFSVDLSDPRNPKIIGELKIQGFSDYLHPYGEGRLLGIGMDVDATGTTTNGVKLSMFDVSNPADVKEVQKYVLKDMYSTNIPYNYKAAFVSVDRNLIGFSAYGEGQHYYLFSYDEKNGFECVLDQELRGYSEGRGVYVGDTFYLVAGNTVESFTMDTYQKIGDIRYD